MKFALSTNWNNRRLEAGEAIADEAIALGFDELELGFCTTPEQVPGIKSRLAKIPVGSVHAFCPVPISAPQGYPELYLLANPDEEARRMARLQVSRCVDFAAEMGAATVVLHAGRVSASAWFKRNVLENRHRRGEKTLPILKAELSALLPLLEKRGVTLALENLPYLEGFPDEAESAALLAEFRGAPIGAWFDTGHDHVRKLKGWKRDAELTYRGMHLSDSKGGDDHLPPGEGDVDFAALKPVAAGVRHLVFEPNAGVTAEALRDSLQRLRRLWA